MEYTNIVDDIPEEGDIVEFKTWHGEICVGFYILPYRAYPNSFFDPFKLARWCEVDFEGSWHPTNKKPISWRLLAKHSSNDEKICCVVVITIRILHGFQNIIEVIL